MSKPLLTAIHHVALICSDYPRSRAFYSETLGAADRAYGPRYCRSW
jgi:catechol 2,3-dioxygenase-like lactoylglutathione lyase family enzyme